MPMSFPDLESLTFRAKQRNFRQPLDNESEETYRLAFADFMQDVDMVEAGEIRGGAVGLKFYVEQDPMMALAMMTGRSRDEVSDIFKGL